jgi:hypothetical protein
MRTGYNHSSLRPSQLNLLWAGHLQSQSRPRFRYDVLQPLLPLLVTFSLRQGWRNAAATEDCREDANELYLGHLLAWAHSGASRPRKKSSLGWNNQILVSDCRAFRNPP